MAKAEQTTDIRNGILQVLPGSRSYYTADDVMEILNIKQAKAYALIRALRLEMIESGILIEDYPVGRIPKRYFNRKCGIEE